MRSHDLIGGASRSLCVATDWRQSASSGRIARPQGHRHERRRVWRQVGHALGVPLPRGRRRPVRAFRTDGNPGGAGKGVPALEQFRSRFAPSKSSFPSSAWERASAKLCFASGSRTGREAELRPRAFPSRAWERGFRGFRQSKVVSKPPWCRRLACSSCRRAACTTELKRLLSPKASLKANPRPVRAAVRHPAVDATTRTRWSRRPHPSLLGRYLL